QYADVFRALGAASIRVVHAERGVSKDDLLLIENASGIFVTGGDQQKLMGHLRNTGCADAIVDAVRSGAVYAGTSAGAAVVSLRMIAASKRRRGQDVIEFGEGLGLVPGVIVDQHFSQRRRLTRLISATSTWNLTGVGIDEDTAAVWRNDGSVEVIGRGAITIVHPEVAAPAPRSYRLHVFESGASAPLRDLLAVR
ncbi:MAG TPA: cyanophycinase, partial [Thermoanaerobaculia bacterium]|nr:cyanophycinase [Thermoanaerobaculia bacterium]